MTIVYLEHDDEITSAISRIRAVSDGEAILVVPPGSKIATSRINFKLLAREATDRRLNAVAVSDEPQVRALAISAGLPAYDSIASAEQALATFREQDRSLAERIDRTMPRQHPDAGEHTMVMPPPASRTAPTSRPTPPRHTGAPSRMAAALVPSDTAVLPAQPSAPIGRARRRRPAIAPLLVLGLVLLLIGGVAYGAYVFLPTATVTVRPTAVAVHAPAFTVTADPNVAVVDDAAGVIPAQVVSVPVHVGGTFNATGIDAHDVKATGTVRFTSENTVDSVAVPANTVVSTSDGIDFVTADDVVVPQASFETGPTQVDVDVRAAKGGDKGNVAANAISVVSSDLARAQISVTNPDPTSGGNHVEQQVVSQQDYDSALATLNAQLPAVLQQTLVDPRSVPRGLVAYPETAQLSTGQPDQLSASVVDVAAPTFTLALDATADITAVNEAQIEQVAAARVRGALASGQKLVGDDVMVSHDEGTVSGNTVVYNVQADGLGYTDPDPQSLLATLRGKSLADAQAALATFGSADISIWPEFVDHLPDQTARISITVLAPSPAVTPSAPAATPHATASTR